MGVTTQLDRSNYSHGERSDHKFHDGSRNCRSWDGAAQSTFSLGNQARVSRHIVQGHAHEWDAIQSEPKTTITLVMSLLCDYLGELTTIDVTQLHFCFVIKYHGHPPHQVILDSLFCIILVPRLMPNMWLTSNGQSIVLRLIDLGQRYRSEHRSPLRAACTLRGLTGLLSPQLPPIVSKAFLTASMSRTCIGLRHMFMTGGSGLCVPAGLPTGIPRALP